jgi:hypothetical protein
MKRGDRTQPPQRAADMENRGHYTWLEVVLLKLDRTRIARSRCRVCMLGSGAALSSTDVTQASCSTTLLS